MGNILDEFTSSENEENSFKLVGLDLESVKLTVRSALKNEAYESVHLNLHTKITYPSDQHRETLFPCVEKSSS